MRERDHPAARATLLGKLFPRNQLLLPLQSSATSAFLCVLCVTAEGRAAVAVRSPSRPFATFALRLFSPLLRHRSLLGEAEQTNEGHEKAFNPVIACPRINVWMSCVPS